MPSVAVRFAILAAGVLSIVNPLSGAEATEPLLGAKAVLEKVRTEGGPAPEPHSFPHFSKQLSAYQKAMGHLAPEEAAKEYLRLCDEFFQNSASYPERRARDAFTPTAFLPPPSAWPALKEAILVRPPADLDDTAAQFSATIRELGLRLLAATLTADTILYDDTYAALQALSQLTPEGEKRRFEAFFTAHCQALVAVSEQPAAILAALTDQLAYYLARPTGTRLAIPDLAAQMDEGKVQAFIEQALITPHLLLAPEGAATRALARKVAVEKINTLKLPQWSLAHDVEATALYKAMERHFGESDYKPIPQMSSRVPDDEIVARQYYLLSLLTAKKEPEAIAFFRKIPNTRDLLPKAEKLGLSAPLFKIWQQSLEKAPLASHWGDYAILASRLGESATALKQLRAHLAKATPEQPPELTSALITLLLASDQLDEALPLIRQTPDAAARLLALGEALDDPALRQEAVSMTAPDSRSPLRLKEGDGAKVEKQLVAALMESVKNTPSESMEQAHALALLYHQQGRYNDLLTLIDQFPFWGASDLAELHHRSAASDLPLPYMAASALVATGQGEKARPILHAVLAHDPAFDPAYELLCRLDGLAALPYLEALAKVNPTRALLWKAQLLFNEKKMGEAEKAVRAAIARDPSGASQATEPLIRAYSILAEIRKARADREEAAACRNLVQALQLTQQGDAARIAGLSTRAIRLYRTALEHHAELFATQAHLAQTLAETGQPDAAKPHFQKAFELMPESSPKSSSHSDRSDAEWDALLSGPHEQRLAEQIFLARTQQDPPSAQAHYLLGLIHEKQGRTQDALLSYRKAIELAPEHLEAWRQLHAITRLEPLPATQRDRIALQLYRRTSAEQRQPTDLAEVTNLPALWESVHQLEAPTAPTNDPTSPPHLYPLLGALQYGSKVPYWQIDWPTPSLAGKTLSAQWQIRALDPLLNPWAEIQ